MNHIPGGRSGKGPKVATLLGLLALIALFAVASVREDTCAGGNISVNSPVMVRPGGRVKGEASVIVLERKKSLESSNTCDAWNMLCGTVLCCKSLPPDESNVLFLPEPTWLRMCMRIVVVMRMLQDVLDPAYDVLFPSSP